MAQKEPPLRWGIVGLGGIVVDSIAPAIIDSSHSRLTACAGSSVEKARAFAERFGVKNVCHSHEDLAAHPEVDAVYVATPNALHHAAVLAAAHANKHVLCEKPFALSPAHGRDMIEACGRAGVVLRIAHQIRLETIIQRVREVVLSGALGDLRSITFERIAPVHQPGGWRKDPRQGGVLFDVAVHLLDLVVWISGMRFSEVSAFSHPDRRDHLPDDTIAILGRLGDRCNVVIRASREIPYARNDLTIEGTKGMLATSALRWEDEYVLQITDASGVTDQRFAAVRTYQKEIEAFAGEVRGERSVLPAGADGLYLITLVESIIDSINSRRAIAL